MQLKYKDLEWDKRIIKKVKELAKLIEGKIAIAIYANNTWKQIGGLPRLTYEDEFNLMKNQKGELVDEILILRRKIKGWEKKKKILL